LTPALEEDRSKAATADRLDKRPAPSTRRPLVVAIVGWVVLATVVQLFRSPDTYPWRTLWEEDGAIFLSDALRRSFVMNLHTPYHGYLQTVPRVVAQAAAAFPLQAEVAVMAVLTALIVSVLAAYIWFASARHIRSPWLRASMTLLVVVLAQNGFESDVVLSDVHWFLCFAAFWAVQRPFTCRSHVVTSCFVVVVAVLSDPLAGLALVPAIFDYVLNRTQLRARLTVVGCLLLAAIVQLIANGGRTVPRDGPTTAHSFVQFFSLRVVESFFVGDRPLHFLVPFGGGYKTAYAISLVALVAFVALLTRLPRRVAATAAFYAVFAVVFLFASLGLRGNHFLVSVPLFDLNASRYTVVPVLLLWWAAILVADGFDQRLLAPSRSAARRTPRPSPLVVGVVGLASATVIASWAVENVRQNQPEWTQALRAALPACRLPPAARPPQQQDIVAFRESFPPITSADVTLPIAPDTHSSVNWVVVVPCSRLLHDLGHPPT